MYFSTNSSVHMKRILVHVGNSKEALKCAYTAFAVTTLVGIYYFIMSWAPAVGHQGIQKTEGVFFVRSAVQAFQQCLMVLACCTCKSFSVAVWAKTL